MFSLVVNDEEQLVFYRFSMLEIVETELISVLSLPSILEERKEMALIPTEICVWNFGEKENPWKNRENKNLEPRNFTISSHHSLCHVEFK